MSIVPEYGTTPEVQSEITTLREQVKVLRDGLDNLRQELETAECIEDCGDIRWRHLREFAEHILEQSKPKDAE